ncbi:MAG TPA: phosphatase PAP2 family protein [Levilinea sp.]|nr:phosphatase PAP2 family protein [Levilinea sp.]
MNWTGISEKDARYSQRMRLDPDHKGWWHLANFFARSGDSWFWMLGLVMVWLFAGPDWRYRSVFMVFCMALLAVIVIAIKFKVRRRRPEGEWGAIYRNADPHSFPSGHAARAFLLAVLALALCPLWWAWVLALWAPLVCAARVAMGVHYISDMLAGMLTGIVVALALLQLQPFIMTVLAFLV